MPNSRPENQNGVSSSEPEDESKAWLAILNQMPVGVTVAEIVAGGFVWHNTEAGRILGRAAGFVSPADEPYYGAIHEDGRPYEGREYPLTRAVFEGEVVERESMHYRRRDGSVLILEVNASRVRSPVGDQLGVCTYQDVTEEYEARRALKDAGERIQLALDAGAIVGTWVWDVPADVITADELFAQSFGLDPERCREGFPAEEAMVKIHPADRPGVEAAVADALAGGGGFRQQYRVLQLDGVYRWVDASGQCELNESGEAIRFPGVLLDITAWKQADEARNVLMREVDHRARNALAIVQSVVRLSDASEPAQYREEVIGRVDALGRAQAALAHSNWEGGVLEDLVRDELAAYAAPAQFALAGPRLVLPAEQVQPFGMIMHEMVMNAVKYGALSVLAGKVEVSWRGHHGSELELTWKESGGPAVSRPQRKGLGSRLIERLAAQLGGAMCMDWKVGGLVAKLTWRH
jgi:PAS domain S-box-containing protein